MIFQIFDSPLADILILLLIARLLFPRIFIARQNHPTEKEKIIYHEKSSVNSSSQKNQEGEYIEYEEIK